MPTAMGIGVEAGIEIRVPRRGAEVYPGGFRAVVLYADERRITLGFTRDNTVANGYALHLENLCVDPNLLALYRQANAAGRGALPALRESDAIGVTLAAELTVAIRDRGAFLDPRSRKDWWQ